MKIFFLLLLCLIFFGCQSLDTQNPQPKILDEKYPESNISEPSKTKRIIIDTSDEKNSTANINKISDPAFRSCIRYAVSDPRKEWSEIKISDLEKVTQLNCAISLAFRGESLTKIKNISGIGFFKNLEILDLSNNAVTQIPPEIKNLKKLKKLVVWGKLDENKLIEFIPEIGELESLEILDFHGNKISKLPDSIGGLKNLKVLNLSFNDLEVLPEEIGGMRNLEELFLGDNKLIKISKTIGNLEKLLILDFSPNKITNIPNSLFNLKNLKELYLEKNSLKFISKDIKNLQNLKILTLGKNENLKIPKEIKELKNLKQLSLRKNNLIKICDDWLTKDKIKKCLDSLFP